MLCCTVSFYRGPQLQLQPRLRSIHSLWVQRLALDHRLRRADGIHVCGFKVCPAFVMREGLVIGGGLRILVHLIEGINAIALIEQVKAKAALLLATLENVDLLTGIKNTASRVEK